MTEEKPTEQKPAEKSTAEKKPAEKKPAAKKAAKESTRGKRYSKEEISKIIAFIQDHNKKNKRGGQKAAAAKFGVTAVTLSRWMKSDDKKAAGKPAKKTAKAGKKAARRGPKKRKAAKPRATRTVASPQDLGTTLARLGEIHQQITDLQAEYNRLKESL